MLDSGAFTYMTSRKGDQIDWIKYATDYAEYIKKNNIKYYFELDIDSVVGTSAVLKLRHIIEEITGTRSIPVWHKCRGKQAFLDMIRDYDYVAIGGIASKEILRKEIPTLKWFVDQAHDSGTEIHGLGLTSKIPEKILPLGFDSVDSTAWASVTRWGEVPKFTGSRVVKIKSPPNSRVRSKGRSYEVNGHSLIEWSKYARYLDRL